MAKQIIKISDKKHNGKKGPIIQKNLSADEEYKVNCSDTPKPRRILTHYSNVMAKRNTKKIILAMLSLRGNNEIITVKKLAKMCRLSRFTFYFRYNNIKHSFSKWETQLIEDCLSFVDRCRNPRDGADSTTDTIMLSKIKDPNRQVVTAWFLFLSQHGEVFNLICQFHANQEILYSMANELYDRLDVNWTPQVPKKDSLFVRFLINHAVVIVTEWGVKNKCDFNYASKYIDMLISLLSNPFRHCYYE